MINKQIYKYAGDRIRTYVSTKLSAPKADPFDHSGTPALIILGIFSLIKFAVRRKINIT